ncbi:MAG: T9SS type A sorting domain-containing protein [Bacteroidetes bacterium]|nr:T9SS type A sorting domain-containing protein [Bacteroidota bacterium]
MYEDMQLYGNATKCINSNLQRHERKLQRRHQRISKRNIKWRYYPYSYVWSNGKTTAANNNLAAGTYTVTVTDANGCTKTCSYTVTQPSALTATCSGTNVSCNGGTNGSASVTSNGGTTPYSYVWSNGKTTAANNNLAAGTYTVTVTDANGCTKTCSYTVTQPSALTATCSGTNVSCNGGTNGSASVTANGGTTPYSYVWSNGKTTAANNNLAAGTYTVTVTDANGCTKTCSYTVTQPSALTATCSGTNVSCNGGTNGSASVTSNGGTTPYSYVWSNGKTTTANNNLAAGTYTVTVTDANGCTKTCSYTVTQPSALTATCSGTNVSCNGGTNGSASVTSNGGTTPYSYVWSNGKTTAANNNLAAGTYTVTVTDANGCTKTCSYTVTQPSALTATCSGTNVSCNGGTNGSASVTSNGGTTPYSYVWSNGKTTAANNNLAAGTYTVTVTDANGCTKTCSYTVTQPSALTATCSGTNVSCNGGTNGSASVTSNGGTTPFSYVWSNGKTTAANNNLAAGTYTVTVTDANGCTKTCSYTVTQPSALTATCSGTSVDCYNKGNGTASVNATGGTLPYTYLWSNGATVANLIGLIPGTYTVTVTDANGCTKTCSYLVTQPAQLVAVCTKSMVNCFGGSNATATIIVTGGTAPFTYLWNNGATTSSLTGLAAGTYSVTVTDSKNCSTACTFIIDQPNQLIATCSKTDISCNGGLNGSVIVTAVGGTGTYNYLWSNGNTASSINGLAAGTYTVTVTDVNGCTSQCNVTIVQPSALIVSCTGTNISCSNGNSGTASVSASGGTAPYTYLWSNGGTVSSIASLAAGMYTVTVTDSKGCTKQCSYNVTQSNALAITCNVSNITCFGAVNGSMSVSIIGGTAPFTYLWSNGATTTSINFLMAGTYSVTVTDANGCSAQCSGTVVQPAQLTANCAGINETCSGAMNGSVSVAVTGGTSPYSYVWSNGKTTSASSNTGAGTYTVTVTDANGCTKTCSVTITSPTPIVITLTGTYQICQGSATGYISSSVTGGTIPYSYLWNNGATTSSISNLLNGIYTVTVTDGAGCTKSAMFQVKKSWFNVSLTKSNVQCFGSANGSIVATVTGNSGPFTYLWSNGGTSSMIQNLGTGIYTVTVTNSLGCTKTVSVIITQPTLITCVTTSTTTSSNSCTGTATTTPAGGIAPYTYLWSNGQTNATATGLCAGFYVVTMTDANGCSCSAIVKVDVGNAIQKATTIEVTEPELLVQAWPNPTSGIVYIGFDKATEEGYDIIVTDVNGKVIMTSSGSSIGGRNVIEYDLSGLSKGVYTLKLMTGTKSNAIRVVLQ